MRRVFVALTALCSLAGCAGSEDAGWQDEPGLSSDQAALGSAYMDCYIDTPALDTYTTGNCIATGNSPSVASFRLSTPTPAAAYVWYDHPECTGAECTVPISPGQRITLSAYYISLNGTPTLGAAATAKYIR